MPFPTISGAPRPAQRQAPATQPASATQQAPADAALSPLQRHVDFFDANHDGQVTRKETKAGLLRLGAGSTKASLASTFINGLLGPLTSKKFTTRVDVEHIARGKHGSDTGLFDAQGNFSQPAFDAHFAKFDADGDGRLSKPEVTAMVKAKKTDFIGNVAAKGEFGLLMSLAADGKITVKGKEVPTISKARLQALYEGTLFQTIAKEREAQAPAETKAKASRPAAKASKPAAKALRPAN